jgi:hypothetical protein
VLRYPADWRATRGDAGSATAELLDGQGRLSGYLNLTPRQGTETLANWSGFRLAHNRAEGNRDVRREGSSRGVRLGGGIAACVRDSYTTVSDARYVELACLVEARGRGSVIVAAAPPRAWRRLEPVLRRAVAAMSA